MPISFDQSTDPTDPNYTKSHVTLPANKRFLVALDDDQEYVLVLYDLHHPEVKKFIQFKLEHSPISFYHYVTKIEDIHADIQLDFKQINLYMNEEELDFYSDDSIRNNSIRFNITDSNPSAYNTMVSTTRLSTLYDPTQGPLYEEIELNATGTPITTLSIVKERNRAANQTDTTTGGVERVESETHLDHIDQSDNHSFNTHVIHLTGNRNFDIGHLATIFDEPEDESVPIIALSELGSGRKSTLGRDIAPSTPLTHPVASSTPRDDQTTTTTHQADSSPSPTSPRPILGPNGTPKQKRTSIFNNVKPLSFLKSLTTSKKDKEKNENDSQQHSPQNRPTALSIPQNSPTTSSTRLDSPHTLASTPTLATNTSSSTPPTRPISDSTAQPPISPLLSPIQPHQSPSHNGNSMIIKREANMGRYRVRYTIMLGKSTTLSNTTKSFKLKNDNDTTVQIDQITRYNKVALQPQPFQLDPDAFLCLPSLQNIDDVMYGGFNGSIPRANKSTLSPKSQKRSLESNNKTLPEIKEEDKAPDSVASTPKTTSPRNLTKPIPAPSVPLSPSSRNSQDHYDIEAIQANVSSIPTTIYIQFELFQGSRLFKKNRLPVASGDFLFNITLLRNKVHRETVHVVEMMNSATKELVAELHFKLDMIFPTWLTDLLTLRYLFKGHGPSNVKQRIFDTQVQLNEGSSTPETPKDNKGEGLVELKSFGENQSKFFTKRFNTLSGPHGDDQEVILPKPKMVRKTRRVLKTSNGNLLPDIFHQGDAKSITTTTTTTTTQTDRKNSDGSEAQIDVAPSPSTPTNRMDFLDINNDDFYEDESYEEEEDDIVIGAMVSLAQQREEKNFSPNGSTNPSSTNTDALFPSIFGHRLNDICDDLDDDGQTDLVNDEMIQRWLRERVIASTPLKVSELLEMDQSTALSHIFNSRGSIHSLRQSSNGSVGSSGQVGDSMTRLDDVHPHSTPQCALQLTSGLSNLNTFNTDAMDSGTPIPFTASSSHHGGHGTELSIDTKLASTFTSHTAPSTPGGGFSRDPNNSDGINPNSDLSPSNPHNDPENSADLFLDCEDGNPPHSDDHQLGIPPHSSETTPTNPALIIFPHHDLVLHPITTILVQSQCQIPPEAISKLDQLPKFASLDVLEHERHSVQLMLNGTAQLSRGIRSTERCIPLLTTLEARIDRLNTLISTGELSVYDYIDQCQDQMLIEAHVLVEMVKILTWLEQKRVDLGRILIVLQHETHHLGSVMDNHHNQTRLEEGYSPSVLLQTDLDHNGVNNSDIINNPQQSLDALTSTCQHTRQLIVDYSDLYDHFSELKIWIEQRQSIVKSEIDTIVDDLAEMGDGGE